ncbi:hypothetical protein C0991_009691 [Blastosporella zonata]|nr:hypothetical protein C0991_009691 [Blastosporella zonata]
MDAFLVNIPEEIMPGAGFDFEDVTGVFKEAAAAMDPGSFVFMDDLTLYDAMSAFEIGEPRLDSGLILENEVSPQFNPAAPLLPQELCWIMDRALAYEIEWHSGNPLCHSVLTMLYIHAMPGIDPEYVTSQDLASFDSSRPPDLVFLILRAWVMGMLKCCDLSWRELSKGGIQDADVFSNPMEFQNLIDRAREHLIIVRSHPAPQPEAPSAALHAFDPSIARCLKTVVPLRVLVIPASEDTWKSIDKILDGWQEICLLAQAHALSTWEVRTSVCLPWKN